MSLSGLTSAAHSYEATLYQTEAETTRVLQDVIKIQKNILMKDNFTNKYLRIEVIHGVLLAAETKIAILGKQSFH